MRTVRYGWFIGLCLVGCQRYQPAPLSPEEVVASVSQERKDVEKGPFTFPRAAELMARHSPSLKEFRAEHETALALAKVKTPLPNPELGLGLAFGSGDAVEEDATKPFGSITFAIPTGRRRSRQDELNSLSAELAFVELRAKHRELYLDLRRQYSEWILTRERLETRRRLSEASDKSMATAKKLAETGFVSPLDIGLLELETTRVRTEILGGRRELAEIEGGLSETLGVEAGAFQSPPEGPLPDVPQSDVDLPKLTALMISNHAGLARLRARYEVAEAELRLEVARQYPDLKFGASLSGEVGEEKTVLGLPVGIELPIFDRNQQGIATARQRREEIRIRYEAAANRALAVLDRARWHLQLAQEKGKLVREVFLPGAEANIRLARKLHEAGNLDPLRLLETERSQRAILIEASDSDLAVRKAWIELEQAVGLPLVAFPGEKPEAFPLYSHEQHPAVTEVPPAQPTGKEQTP